MRTWKNHLQKAVYLSFHHLRRHVGVGLICAVAYFDPGNWGVDLEAGSKFGYRLLFVILLSGLFAILLQVLASRLGCVTGLDLASHCRLLLYSHPTHPRLVRWSLLYPLYALSEIAIIATDLAELLGSAVALCLLFPKLELWHGVLITTCDVVFLLCLGDPLRGKPLKWFELLIGALVLSVMVCMCIIISKLNINWGDTFEGYLPSKYVFPNGAGYISVGIIGATIMPHSLFLGSALATQDRAGVNSESSDNNAETNVSTTNTQTHAISRPQPTRSSTASSSLLFIGPLSKQDTASSTASSSSSSSSPSRLSRFLTNFLRRTYSFLRHSFETSFRVPPPTLKEQVDRYADWENNSGEFVKSHIYHGTVDVVMSLLGFAVVINMFFYGNVDGAGDAGLFDAYDLIKELVGPGAATIFALALLFAGQSSSIIATVAGQAVAEGFIRWRVSPIFRRLLTRLIAVIPSMAVAIALGRPGIDALLIASQVVLSVVLPFISFPLVYLTSKKSIMCVKVPASRANPRANSGATNHDDLGGLVHATLPIHGGGERVGDHDEKDREEKELESQPEDTVLDYSNNLIVTLLAFGIWMVIVVANVYVIVTLGSG
ncbi:Nramp-domain-containing protein [Dendrothele bispora CBS 962.96]|uniref:Nramp-domain-containing protein n=1 Tax=Dendrothele bispora (strain CBS 962.96) TaxID=1314807 RepID=A0A4S8KTR3_DENBC|nr:Nramp-domain-containing protein [Dendrothele bispora CBS 962.96]